MLSDNETVSFDFFSNFENIFSHTASHLLSDGVVSGDTE